MHVQGAFSALAQGDLPYASGYWLSDYYDYSELPAWPMRAACELLSDEDMDDVGLINVG